MSRAFTMLELIAVVGILAVVLALTVQAVADAKRKAQEVRRQVWIRQWIDRSLANGWLTREQYESQMEWLRGLRNE